MNYFLDTEFSKLPWEKGSHLISFGLVSEKGAQYSACLEDIDLSNISEFVQKNVIPYLPPVSERKSREHIRKDVQSFVGSDSDPIFWAIFPDKKFLGKVGLPTELVAEYYSKFSDYDFQLFKGLWKPEDYPSSWPTTCKNLTELLSTLPKESLPVNRNAHNPLSDALWDLEVWKLSS